MGLVRYAATPNSRQRATSPRWPATVSIIIVASASSGSSLICSASANPSMSGMRRSVKTRGKGVPASFARRIATSASRPPDASRGLMCQPISCSSSIRRFVALSSTTSTRRPRRSVDFDTAAFARGTFPQTETRREVKRAAFAGFALHPNAPPHHLDKMRRDRQSRAPFRHTGAS